MGVPYKDVPWGIKALQRINEVCCNRLRFNRDFCYRASVLFLTYMAYMTYHLSRKPISVVKNVLHQNCQNMTPPANVPPEHIKNWCDWAPFDGSDSEAAQLFGTLDSSFLFAYAIAMFASGFIAERVNLRYFLALGMLGSGVFSYLFGIAKSYGIHSMAYFVFVQVCAGIFQTTGWPGVVTVLGNWFGKSKRGLIFGIWNSHTSIGNILGSVISAEYVEDDWALCFIVPGVIIGGAGFIVFLFLVPHPADVGSTVPDDQSGSTYKTRRGRPDIRPINRESSDELSSEPDDSEIFIGEQVSVNRVEEPRTEVQRRLVTERTPILRDDDLHSGRQNGRSDVQSRPAIGFMGALRIPGVVEFSLSLFFAKLVSYTFLYWLPQYIKASTTLGSRLSADLSTLFDVGGIAGAIAAGVVSDYSEMPAATCVVMLLLAAPSMYVYQQWGTHSIAVNMFLLIVVGLLVNGPYSLITTAVSAELGTHKSLGHDSRALATVTAIIDGTGSLGAAVGPLFASFVQGYGWDNVFVMLIVSDVLSLVLLLRLFKREIIRYRQSGRARS